MENIDNSLATQLREVLAQNMVSFTFVKANGEFREAHGTRSSDGLEKLGAELPKGTGTEKAGVIAYWDLDKEAWRSCKEDSIVSINGMYSVEEYMETLQNK